jgi:hypothetical protein
MSTTPPTVPVAEPAHSPLPPERRTLVALLATLEGLLLVAASVLVPLKSLPYTLPTTCVTPSDESCGYLRTHQVAFLVAAGCAVVALLVLPPVMGALSRRWQTALVAPSLPVWLLVLAEVALAFVSESDTINLVQTSYLNLFYAGTVVSAVVANFAGPLVTVLYLVVGLGGLGWLARRAFAR